MRNSSSDKGPFEKLRQEHDGRLRFRVSIVAIEEVVIRHVALKGSTQLLFTARHTSSTTLVSIPVAERTL